MYQMLYLCVSCRFEESMKPVFKKLNPYELLKYKSDWILVSAVLTEEPLQTFIYTLH